MKKTFVMLACMVMLTLCILASCSKDVKEIPDEQGQAVSYDDLKTNYVFDYVKENDEFNKEGNVSVIEGVTIASRLHAVFHDTEVKPRDEVSEYRLDFDDPEILVDLSERNSRNNHGVNFNRATGTIEDGVLICKAGEPNANGSYDPQIRLAGLNVEAKTYNKINFRMKRDPLPNTNDAKRVEAVEIFFATNVSQGFAASKQINTRLPEDKDLSDWFEVELDLGNHAEWKDVITDVRFDPTNNNGVYYIDYIVFSKSENIDNAMWYDMYVDYAIDNGLVLKDTFVTDEYSRDITREEMLGLVAAAVPEEYFTKINDIKGIPDISEYRKNADVYLMFYNAGIILGKDEKGNFVPDGEISKSEIREIVGRIAVPETRLSGAVDCDWSKDASPIDIDFDNEESLSKIKISNAEAKIKDGALVLTAKNSGLLKEEYDPQIIFENISLRAEDYIKLRVRMKADFIGEPEDVKYDFYFKSENDLTFSDKKVLRDDFVSKCYRDLAGWYIIEVDLPTHFEWTGKIKEMRFDPANVNGTYTIDFIRLVENDPLYNASHKKLLAEGYTFHGMLQDIGFERGFFVQHYEQKNVNGEDRNWQYTDTEEKPTWDLGPWWNGYDLWENRVMDAGKYVLTDDKGINTIIYNPEEKSISMRVNATKIYNGEPHDVKTYNWWPHLLLNQQYTKYPVVDKAKNSAAADRIYVELDMRITDFKDTINKQGANSCQFPLYLYFITDKAPTEKIWFGLSLMNGTGASHGTKPGWAPDSAAHQYMYSIPQATVYDGMLNSFNPIKGRLMTGNTWKHIRVDITPHIDRCIEWANRDKAFGVEVAKEDMYFGGCNIGFEIHGNYDCTIEIKNLDIIAYNKD